MKKIKSVMAILVIMLVVTSNCYVAHAAEQGMVIREGESVVRILSEEERLSLDNEITETVIGSEVSVPLYTTRAYDAYQYSKTYNFYNGDTWIAAADIACIVYRYTDGKVHLYSREIGIRRLASYSAYKTYGSIVNTDGSVCYTTGDQVTIYDNINAWTYAIDFSATPTGQSFNCYQVNY